jgi:predicted acyltransferase
MTLNGTLRGLLAVIVFIVAAIIVGLVAYGKIQLQHASLGILVEGLFYFVFHLFLLFSFAAYAIKNKNNPAAFFFLSFMTLVELFLLIYLIMHFSTRYIELAIIFTVLIAIIIIDVLINKENPINDLIKQIKNKEKKDEECPSAKSEK